MRDGGEREMLRDGYERERAGGDARERESRERAVQSREEKGGETGSKYLVKGGEVYFV